MSDPTRSDRGPYYEVTDRGPLVLGPEQCHFCEGEIEDGDECVETTFHNPGGPGDLEERIFHKDCYHEDDEE